MERETGIEPATFSLARRCSTTEPLPLVRYVCETKIAYQGRFVNDLIVRQSEEPGHGDIFVNRFPMNAPGKLSRRMYSPTRHGMMASKAVGGGLLLWQM